MRFPEFSGEWEKIRFENAVTLQRGSSPRPIIEFITKSCNGVNWVKIGDMPKYGRLVTCTEEKITKEGAKKSRHVNIGDLILSNSMSYGQPYIMGIEGYIHDGWFVLKKYGNTFDRDYLCNLLISPAIQNQYRRLAAGGVVQNISSDLVNSVFVSMPSLKEQQKIASLLNLIDDRIATQRKIIEKYESLIRGLTDDAFNRNCGSPMLSFSNIYKDAGEGGTPSTSNSEYYEDGTIPFIKIDDLVTKYLVTHKDCITEQGMHKSSAWLIPSGSVIYSNGATIGSISINTYPVCTKQGILGIIPKDNVDVEYLYYFMTSVYFRKEIHRIITEGTMKTAYLKDINKILCPLPCLETQKSIANKLATITKKIELDKRALSLFQTQKKHLLSHLFI